MHTLFLSYLEHPIIKPKVINEITSMKKDKLFGLGLIALGFIVIIGMIINNHIFWFIIDIMVILYCIVAGIYLFTLRKQ